MGRLGRGDVRPDRGRRTPVRGFNGDNAWLRARVAEILGLHYALPWPNREPVTARDVRQSPVHSQVAAAGAVFGSKMGWERPNVFAPTPGAELDYAWGKPSWLPWSAAEQRATREAVAVFDQTSFSKYVVAGPRALEALQWVCAADVDVPVGHCVYTPWLNARGSYEADLTVTRDGPDSFWIVSSSATTVRDLDWLRRHGGVEGGDVTDAFAVLGVMGPASRDLLERISSDDWSEDGFPFATSRTATVAGVPLRATRMTYVGELGWELTVPVGAAATVYDALFGEGAVSVSATPATTRSTRSGWRRGSGPSRASCRPTTPRSRPGWCSPPR